MQADTSLDWSTQGIVQRRETYYAASQRAFVPYKTPLIFSRGSMQYLWDENGKRYIDLLGMNVCVSVGHAHPKVNAAVHAQIDQLQHCTTMFFHPVPAHFAQELVQRMPKGHDWVVHFTSSGSEAVDLALVMAQGHTGHIDILAEIDRTIRYATSGQLAGMIVEPIQGYGGIVECPPGYLQGAFERVRAHGGVCIVDEIQSGFGRTGDHFWGFEAHGVVPETVVLAKGIGNGFPLAAVVAQRHVAESMAKKFFFNTYGASPMACAAGRAVLQVIDEEALQANSARTGAALRAMLERLQAQHEIIGDVRGARPDAGY